MPQLGAERCSKVAWAIRRRQRLTRRKRNLGEVALAALAEDDAKLSQSPPQKAKERLGHNPLILGIGRLWRTAHGLDRLQ